MKPQFTSIAALAAAFLSSCNPERGKPREAQLESTADRLEAKAEEVLDGVEMSAEAKEGQAQQIRETEGDLETAEALEKDAEVTREVGQLRAEQLEEQAERVREQKE